MTAFRMAVVVLCFALASPVRAEVFRGDPANYTGLVDSLQPGDTLELAAGTYNDLLNVSGLHGTPDAWITIRGPATGDPAIFEADPGPCCNTIEFSDSSYVAFENLTIDGHDDGGSFAFDSGDGVHHIRIENCRIISHGGSQQQVGIAHHGGTTWGWIIRGNRIVGAGTGIYLGNSDGTDPFIGGLIENNLIMDSIGYCMQIKHQNGRSAVAGMPTDPQTTIIRNNVFIKNDRPSPDGDRPNLLVGGFPDSGLGSEDRYEIYGNFFFHNPRESLLQASGRVSIHDNVFVDVAGTAILATGHDLPFRLGWIYNNTIFAAGTGISVGNAADQSIVFGNLIFADDPISGSPDLESDNIVDSIAAANDYVVRPSRTLGAMDFYPLAGRCQGAALDLSAFAADRDWDRDFNGTPKGERAFRGAYAGEGTNPGWALTDDVKPGTGAAGVTPVTDLRVVVSGNDLQLGWTHVTTTGGVLYYRVYDVRPDSAPSFTRTGASVLGTPAGASFVHAGAAVDGVMHWYDVATVSTGGQEAVE